MTSCEGCRRVALAGQGKDSHLIHEFPGSLLFLGDHQAFQGYSVLMLKSHARELHDLDPGDARRLMDELAQASRALAAAFKPWKLNHASLGNQMQHLHWHIFPRYESDPDRLQNPWFKMEDFSKQLPDAAARQTLIAKIRRELA